MSDKRIKWSEEQLDFLSRWYGKIRPSYICDILGKTRSSIIGAVRINEIRAHDSLFGEIKLSYNGVIHTIQGQRYETTYSSNGRNCKDTKVRVKKKKKLRVDNKPVDKTVMITPFCSNGKKLVKIDNKTWVYR